jgi:hypothetical protein
MRPHLAVVSGILLIPSVIDFAVAAPVLVQEKHQARAGIVGITEDAVTTSGKRVGDWEKVWQSEDLTEGRPGYHFLPKPPKSSAARLSKPPAGPMPADGWTNVKQRLPTIPEEPPSGPSLSSKLGKKFTGFLWSLLDSGGKLNGNPSFL